MPSERDKACVRKEVNAFNAYQHDHDSPEDIHNAISQRSEELRSAGWDESLIKQFENAVRWILLPSYKVPLSWPVKSSRN